MFLLLKECINVKRNFTSKERPWQQQMYIGKPWITITNGHFEVSLFELCKSSISSINVKQEVHKPLNAIFQITFR